MIDINALLSPQASVVHRTRRWLFEKRITVLDGQKYVLYRFGRPKLAKRLIDFLQLTAGRGVPTQRLVVAQSGCCSTLKHRGAWVAVTYEDGNTWNTAQVNQDQANSLARALAGLHSIESESSGFVFKSVFRPHDGGLSRLRSGCEEALSAADGLHEADKLVIRHWLAVAADSIGQGRIFRLVHGDFYGKNVVLCPDGVSICLIDYELAAYEYAGLELATGLVRFVSGKNARLRTGFLQTYLKECSESVRKEWKVNGAFFLICGFIRLAGLRVNRARILKRRGVQEEANQRILECGKYLSDALMLVQAQQNGVLDPEALLAVIKR